MIGGRAAFLVLERSGHGFHRGGEVRGRLVQGQKFVRGDVGVRGFLAVGPEDFEVLDLGGWA